MHQVLMNLVTNAAHAIGAKIGTVTVALDRVEIEEGLAPPGVALRPGVYGRLSVSDTGPGIDPAILDRIFEPFFTTKPVGEGTGLGLSMIHGIVTAHGGGIATSSESGAGSCFCVYLPLIPGDDRNDLDAGSVA
jgi:signal transduction histidine kinase